MTEVSFGEWLKRQRNARGLTQKQLAHEIALAVVSLRKIEAEERRPSAQIVERLADIFDIPSNERKTFLRFARGDWTSSPHEAVTEIPRLTSTPSPRSNLPETITSLIGREKEVADVCGYLLGPSVRLVSLIGPPGIGKTRLSMEAARTALPNFPDGVFFAALATLDNPIFLSQAVIRAAGFVEKTDIPAAKQLIEGIGEKRILLVLDNCEHLIEAVALLASELLSACPHLKILATSRESLRVSGEWLYTVPVLDIPDEISSPNLETASRYSALVLFVERARAVRSNFELDAGNIQEIVSICAQLDGLPLAIELIAAHIRLMSPKSLLARLNDQYMLFADGMRALPVRQKTLHNAIGWSYNLLSEEEQDLFARLSVFSGGFTLEAAEAVFSRTVKEKSITQLITSLFDKSLVQRTLDNEARSESRFTMLVTIQQFALDRLRRSGREAEARDWHLEYFLDLAERGDQEIRGPAQVEWADRIEREHDNFRAALDWSVSNRKTKSALRLLCALGWQWEIRGHYSAARNWLDKIHRLPGVNDYPVIYAKLLNHIGRHSWLQDNLLEARSLLEESQAITIMLGTEGECTLAETLNWLGLVVLFDNNDTNTAKSMFERSLELYQKWRDENGIALSILNLGIIESGLDHYDIALALLERSLRLFRQFGDLYFIARVSTFLGYLFLKMGNYEKARFFFQEHLRIDKELQYWDGIAEAWRDLGNLYRHQEKYEQASQCYEESVLICREHGLNKYDPFYVSGLLALYLDNYSLALQRFAYLLERVWRLEEKTNSFELVWKTEEKSNTGILMIGLAAVAARINQFERAARLYGAAKAIWETHDSQVLPLDRADFDRHIQSAREQLGDVNFEVLAAEGRRWTMEQSIQYALDWSASE